MIGPGAGIGVGAAGALIKGGIAAIFNKKFQLPPPPVVGPLETGKDLLANYNAYLEGAQNQASLINRFNIADMLSAANQFGGLGDLFKKSAGVASDWLSGRMGTDLMRSLKSGAAARALGAAPGGSTWNFSYAPLSFGLTGNQLQQQGVGATNQLMNQFQQMYQPFNYIAAFMPTWAQMNDLQRWNATNRFNVDLAQRQENTKPTGWSAFLQTSSNEFADMLMGAGGQMAGTGLAAGPQSPPPQMSWGVPGYSATPVNPEPWYTRNAWS